mmetsp:Transcript_36191/g.90297  ORF Transcript_36191/g.90297 Transcript_36191/m.90297 type:complete len:215 (-) Transcript_36191:2355-2999(-)
MGAGTLQPKRLQVCSRCGGAAVHRRLLQDDHVQVLQERWCVSAGRVLQACPRRRRTPRQKVSSIREAEAFDATQEDAAAEVLQPPRAALPRLLVRLAAAVRLALRPTQIRPPRQDAIGVHQLRRHQHGRRLHRHGRRHALRGRVPWHGLRPRRPRGGRHAGPHVSPPLPQLQHRRQHQRIRAPRGAGPRVRGPALRGNHSRGAGGTDGRHRADG